jgi:hypothetical protein
MPGSEEDRDERQRQTGERVLFALYLALIVGGLVFFTVVGLAHR